LTLYWLDRNLRFHLYDPLKRSQDIGGLLREIDCDLLGINPSRALLMRLLPGRPVAGAYHS
jgi:hypothetical protein